MKGHQDKRQDWKRTSVNGQSGRIENQTVQTPRLALGLPPPRYPCQEAAANPNTPRPPLTSHHHDPRNPTKIHFKYRRAPPRYYTQAMTISTGSAGILPRHWPVDMDSFPEPGAGKLSISTGQSRGREKPGRAGAYGQIWGAYVH